MTLNGQSRYIFEMLTYTPDIDWCCGVEVISYISQRSAHLSCAEFLLGCIISEKLILYELNRLQIRTTARWTDILLFDFDNDDDDDDANDW